MTNSPQSCTLWTTKLWFERARPEPTTQHFIAQLGVHFEEVGECIAELEAADITTSILLNEAEQAINALAKHLKQNSAQEIVTVVNEDLFLDSLCDQLVTATGVGHTRGYDIVDAMVEVNRSNFSKFDENGQPLFDENKKIIKGPNYSKAVLTPYLP